MTSHSDSDNMNTETYHENAIRNAFSDGLEIQLKSWL